MRFVEVPEVASRINGLLSGEYQFACDIPPDQIADHREESPRSRSRADRSPTTASPCSTRTTSSLPIRVMRRAITHAIDRQAIVDSLWAGRTRVPRRPAVGILRQMFIEGWTVPAFDPAKARRIC